jgi:hypothetical protein
MLEASLALAAVSTVMQYEAAQDQKDASERQFEAERRKADIQNVREVRNQIRQQRMTAGAIEAQGANAGVSGSSGVMGGIASTQSQLAGNISYMGDVDRQNRAIGQAQVDMGAAQAAGAQWGAVGALGGTIFNSQGGFKTLFGGTSTSGENKRTG